MDAYHYDSATGAFTGVSKADPNPQRPDDFLCPAFAVFAVPPQPGVNQWPVWRDESWILVPDYRGQIIHSAALREQEMQRSLGNLEQGWALGALPPLTEDLVAQKRAAINARAQQAVAQITDQYPQFEIDTFADQERDARAWLADNDADTPTLTLIAARRGISMADLANRVIAKAESFRPFVASVIGRRQALEDQLDAIDVQAANAAELIAAIDETQLLTPGVTGLID